MSKLWMAVVSVALAGCGVSTAEVQESGDFSATQESSLASTNGRPMNARPMNGRGVNGRPVNGRAVNARPVNGRAVNGLVYGFSINGVAVSPGLRDANFDAWFNEDMAASDIAFRYIYRCAAPAGTTVTYQATNGVTYSWPGTLGLAPRWAATAPIADDANFVSDQEAISSCLLSLTNSLATPVEISAGGPGLPVTTAEAKAFPNSEGAFFGNLFAETPVSYACSTAYNTQAYGTIACQGGACPYIKGRTCATDPASCGFTNLGACDTMCTWLQGCTFGGRTWSRPVWTSLKPFCGDGVCNGTNEGPAGSRFAACRADCSGSGLATTAY